MKINRKINKAKNIRNVNTQVVLVKQQLYMTLIFKYSYNIMEIKKLCHSNQGFTIIYLYRYIAITFFPWYSSNADSSRFTVGYLNFIGIFLFEIELN